METQRYIYGYGDGKEYKCYIVDKTDLNHKLFYSSGGFNTPPLWGETRGIKSDCNTL